MQARKTALAITATAIASLLAMVLVLNLSLGNKQVDAPLVHLYGVADPQFPRAMASVLNRGLLDGNRIDELLNGDEIFPAMLGAIRAARHTITLETYIYWSGSIGREFSQALSERAKHGVRVHVLLDWIGGQLEDSLLETMRENGVQVRRYNAPHWDNLHRLNNRTHRKLLVVDGQAGFIGGVGIADTWRGNAQDAAHWRDTHFKAQGPVVAQMESAFIDNWLQATGEVLHAAAYIPRPRQAGTARAHVFTSAPGGGAESMQLMYLMSITAAAESIHLCASYFLPDDVAVDSLVAALRRGVEVQIILPGPYMDVDLVRHASRAGWGRLLAAGAQIYEYQPTMFHSKVMVVDRLWVSVGSTNFDNRSFSINDEANMNVYDASFARRQVEVFEQDLKHSRRVTLQEWQARPWHEKLLDAAAALLRSQL